MAYNPNQPRAAKGTPIGGQWIDEDEAADNTMARRAALSAKRELVQERLAGKQLDYQTIDMMDESGYWGRDRERMHDEIEARFFEGKNPVDNPETYIMGGGPAAGKSTVLSSGGASIPDNCVSVDSDYIKTLLPEYGQQLAMGNPNASLMVHEESSYLAKRISYRAVNESYNVVKDGTGDNSIENLTASVVALGGGERPVNAIYVTIPIDTALERAWERAKINGRMVPQFTMVKTHKGVSAVFPEAIKRNIFSTVKLFDNTFTPPRLIAEKRNGEVFRVLDKELYAAFLAKVNYGG